MTTPKTPEMPETVPVKGLQCGDCAIGRASGAGAGQFCPFIVRQHPRGAFLCNAGAPADYVWLIKEGVVGLGRSPGDVDQLEAIRLPGGYIGLECLVRDSYLCTARALTRVTLCGATREGFQRWLRQTDERVGVVLEAALSDPLLVEMVQLQGGLP